MFSFFSCFHYFFFYFFMFLFLQDVFGCFHCWLHLFTALFLHCLSGTSLLCCCTASATDLKERFYSQAFFTLNSFLLLSRLPWGQQFRLEGCRASHRGLKHRLGPFFCLNTVFGKRYLGSLYVLGAATDYYINHSCWFRTRYTSNNSILDDFFIC